MPSIPDIRVDPPGPRSRALAERLRLVESRNVTWLGPRFPVFWDSARGSAVTDVDSNTYLDFTSAFGVTALGHQDARVSVAVQSQAERLTHGMGDIHPPALKVELLERLASLAPWPDTRIVLASAGSEAVEIALKTAELATGRPGVLAFQGGYHGLTLGALSATSGAAFRTPFRARLFDGVRHLPWPADSAAVDGILDQATDWLDAPGGPPIGAVILEPIQARAGVRIPPAGFLEGLAERTRAAGALLILDEIFTGFGRTGTLWAHENEGLVPDLLCVGKALGGGMPISACMAPASVMDSWPDSTGEAIHTSTFLGHPLTCRAALAFLDALGEDALVERAARAGTLLGECLRDRLSGLPAVTDVRGRGLLHGVEVTEEAARVAGMRGGLAACALRKGLLVLPAGPGGRVLEIVPPLTTPDDLLERGVSLLADTLTELSAER